MHTRSYCRYIYHEGMKYESNMIFECYSNLLLNINPAQSRVEPALYMHQYISIIMKK